MIVAYSVLNDDVHSVSVMCAAVVPYETILAARTNTAGQVAVIGSDYYCTV